MSLDLIRFAEECGIIVEFWDFKPPLEAVYRAAPGFPSVIGISNSLLQRRGRAYFRCVFAEELGHHFTTAGIVIPVTYFHYADRLAVSKAEYLAQKWAALFLMPSDDVIQAIRSNICEVWNLAEYFDVTEDMVQFRMTLPDIQNQLPPAS
jgi:Zn-dependent peptidase ImmA (M78 family)